MNLKITFIAAALIAYGSLDFGALASAQSEPVQSDSSTCGLHELEKSFETENFWVYICREEDKLFYVRFDKSSSSNPVRLSATRTPEGRYIARDRGTDYFIDSERLEVRQNGNRTLSEPVINSFIERSPDLSAIPEGVLQSCQNQIVKELDPDPENISITNAQALDGEQYSVFWRLQDSGVAGGCKIGVDGNILAFVTEQAVEDNIGIGDLRSFGKVPDIGLFSVVRGTYKDKDSLREFDAVVDGKQERWWANCRTEALGKDDWTAPRNNVTGNIRTFVCTDSL